MTEITLDDLEEAYRVNAELTAAGIDDNRSHHGSATELGPSVDGVRVGDYFVCSWGYDQTNIDFYRVVGLTAKRIKVQRWSSKRTVQQRLIPGDGPKTSQYYLVDADGRRTGELSEPEPAPILVKQVRTLSDRPSFYVASYADAYLWDGQPEADTTTYGGAGH